MIRPLPEEKYKTDELFKEILALNDQVKRLIRAERNLSLSQQKLDRQLERVEALNRFSLEAARLKDVPAILGAAIDLLLFLFPFEQGIAFLQSSEGGLNAVLYRALTGRESQGGEEIKHLPIDNASLPRDPWISSVSEMRSLSSPLRPLIDFFEARFGGNKKNNSLSEAPYLALPVHSPRNPEELQALLLLRRVTPEASLLEPLPNAEDASFLTLIDAHIANAVQNVFLYQAALQSEKEARQVAAERAAQAADNARLYQQAKEAIRVRDEFLSIASHELRTPITPIKSGVQLLSQLVKSRQFSTYSQERLAQLLLIIDRELTHLTRLVDGMLEVTRITSGRLILRFEEVDPNTLIQDIIERYKSEIILAQSPVELDLQQVKPAYWDRTRIEQVITNLLTNALKYGDKKPILITSRSHGDSAIITVEDHGVGIAKKDQTKIFEQFERIESSPRTGGLGLGLYIVRQIVEAHHGKINVTSEEGKGATFILELPLRPVAAEKY